MIVVEKCGALNTVQDMGRTGYRHMGVGISGAADQLAAQTANLLVGNDPAAACLELTFGPCVFRFVTEGRVALTGADFSAQLDGRPLAPHWSVPVQAGQCLRLQGASRGMRAYLAVSGGIDVPIVLGARATDVAAGFGGYNGRMLARGDELTLGEHRLTAAALKHPAFGIRQPFWLDGRNPWASTGSDSVTLRVLPGPEYILFSVDSQRVFWRTPWTLRAESNRMGVRLSGAVLNRTESTEPGELGSHAVLPGVIQVPSAGRPIILMQDAQTTGGYPRIGVVIRADLGLLAQCRPGDALQFEPCDIDVAQAALDRQEDWMLDLKRRLSWLYTLPKQDIL